MKWLKWSMTSIDQQQNYEIIYNRIQFKQLPSFISNVISMSRFFLRKFSSLKYFVDENFRLKINIDDINKYMHCNKGLREQA